MLLLPAVEDKSGYKRTSIYNKVKEGTFPAPVKLGPRRIAWAQHVLDEFLSKKITESARDRNSCITRSSGVNE
jgi:prophage regulatory protein